MNADCHIAHIVYRFDYGGLENGIVNLVNRMPRDRFRHSVICLAGYGEKFIERLDRTSVQVISIDKRPGKDLPSYFRLWRVLRSLRPDIVHTRNIGTVDMQWVAMAAGVSGRVHGEHGWTADDPTGKDKRKLAIRRSCRPAIHRHLAMSHDIAVWLERDVGVPAASIQQIYNGVDTFRCHPDGPVPADLPWAGQAKTVIGTVGRLDPVKNQGALLQSVRQILDQRPELRQELRLIIAGDGPERAALEGMIRNFGLTDEVWVPGAREDVPALMRAMDVFVLPSVNEGISNTILEAMATGRPVVAARVGGNPELVENGTTGTLYSGHGSEALAEAIFPYLVDPNLRTVHGRAARERVLLQFSLPAMVDSYVAFYDELLNRSNAAARSGHAGRGQRTARQTRTLD